MTSKPFKTFEEQLEILKDRGLTIENECDTISKLKSDNYYNIINGYKDLFIITASNGNETFISNATFDDIYNLYLFDRSIRNIIFNYILSLENKLRTQISYTFAKYHDSNNFLVYTNFETLSAVGDQKAAIDRATKIYNLISNIEKDISKSLKHKDYIKHYITKYGYVPIWVLVNVLPLNRLSDFYKYMNQSERIEVSMYWNVMEKDLRQYIALLANFRNLCAHDERIYCTLDKIKIPDTYIHNQLNIPKDSNNVYLKGKNDLFALIIIFKMLLSQDEFINLFNKIRGRIESLATKLNSIPIEVVLDKMGFPENWKEIKLI